MEAAEMLAAIARDVLNDVTQAAVLELSWGRERHVKTAEGERMYHASIGSLITFHMRQKAREQHGTETEARVHGLQESGREAARNTPEADQTRDPLTGMPLPPPPEGAAAIYPGVKLPLRTPGDTISGLAFKHVPKPAPMAFPAPVPQEEPQTRNLRGPGGLQGRINPDGSVETMKWDGSWGPAANPAHVAETWVESAPRDQGEAADARAVGQAMLDHFTGRVQQAAARKAQKLADEEAFRKSAEDAAALKAKEEQEASERPLNDAEFSHHTAQTEDTIAKALQSGKETFRTESEDGRGVAWKPERAAQHKEIVDQYLKQAVKVPSNGHALIVTGRPGAGKTSTLKAVPGIDTRNYVTLGADDIKEEMAKRGMIPEVPGLSPMEAAPLVHEESRHITRLVASELYRRKKNIIWDTTVTGHRPEDLRAAGYSQVGGIHITTAPEIAVQRARSRYRAGAEAFRQGKGTGGRLMPAAAIRAHQSDSEFEHTKDKFDWWAHYENSGPKPKLTEGRGTSRPASILSAEEIVRRLGGPQ